MADDHAWFKRWNSQESVFLKNLGAAAQILAIAVAGIWAAWAFYEKEIKIPSAAPINVSLKLQLQKDGLAQLSEAHGGRLMALQLNVTATNPSTLTVYLLGSAWIVRGYAVASAASDAKSFRDSFEANLKTPNALSDMNAPLWMNEQSDAVIRPAVLIGGGHVFSDYELEPGETITRTETIYVPPDAFGLVEADVLMPTARTDAGLQATWTLDANLHPVDHICRVSASKCDPLDVYDPDFGLQRAHAQTQLALGP